MKTYDVMTSETVTRWYRLKLPDSHPFSAAVDAIADNDDREPEHDQWEGEEVVRVDAVDGSTFSGAARR